MTITTIDRPDMGVRLNADHWRLIETCSHLAATPNRWDQAMTLACRRLLDLVPLADRVNDVLDGLRHALPDNVLHVDCVGTANVHGDDQPHIHVHSVGPLNVDQQNAVECLIGEAWGAPVTLTCHNPGCD